jgi:hypothetical protein
MKEERGFMGFIEGESSRMRGGVRMVAILLVSLIWWDHSHPFEPLHLLLYNHGLLMEKVKK